MTSLSAACLCQAGALKHPTSVDGRFCAGTLQTSFVVSVSSSHRIGFAVNRRFPLFPIRCEKEDDHIKHIPVERPPYHSYFDPSSGQLEPASGARPSIPDQEFWPEGTAERARSARAPEPEGVSSGSPSFGKKPGSRRKKYKASASVSESVDENAESMESDPGKAFDEEVIEEPKDVSHEFVSYEMEAEEIEAGYDLEKKLGRPHPFIDPEKRQEIEGTLENEELWWNWRKPDKEQWSRWQRRKPDVETVFLKAMAETGEVKLYGENPTLTETSLYRARKHLYKEERLQAEQQRLERDGPIAYYSEWVKAWKRDTSREAIKRRYEETGEDETKQLIEMFCQQTDSEYRIMMGTDIRIKRDPLAMRMREDQIKQIWGGDPVYPTINYIQDPNEIIDFRGPDFHEPTPDMLDFLKEHGKIVSREELQKILSKEKAEQIEMSDMDEAMASAVDIGENDDGEEDSEVDAEVVGEDAGEEDDEEEELEEEQEDNEEMTENWSVRRTTPYLRKSKTKSKKKDKMSLDEAIGDSENLTDFLMDFEEED